MSSPRSRSQHGVNRRSKHAGLLRIPRSFCKNTFARERGQKDQEGEDCGAAALCQRRAFSAKIAGAQLF